jgi:hypothetical protein
MIERNSYSYGNILLWASNDGAGGVLAVVVTLSIGVDADMVKVVGCCAS